MIIFILNCAKIRDFPHTTKENEKKIPLNAYNSYFL